MKQFFKRVISIAISLSLIFTYIMVFDMTKVKAAPIYGTNILKGSTMNTATDLAAFKGYESTNIELKGDGIGTTGTANMQMFYQSIDLSDYLEHIKSGEVTVTFGSKFKGGANGKLYIYPTWSFGNEVIAETTGSSQSDANTWKTIECSATIPTTYDGGYLGTQQLKYLYVAFMGWKEGDNTTDVKTYWKDAYVIINDKTAPRYLETKTNTLTSSKWKLGDTISYTSIFNEAINWDTDVFKPTFDVNGTESNEFTQTSISSDGRSITYSFAIPNIGTVGDDIPISLKSIQYKLTDLAGNILEETKTPNITHTADNKSPTVTLFQSDLNSNQTLKKDGVITFNVGFSENIKVDSEKVPYIQMDGKYNAVYKSQNSNELTFEYTVKEADTSANLQVTSVNFDGITDSIGNAVSYQPSDHNNALSGKNIKIDNAAPTVVFSPYDGAYVGKNYNYTVEVTDDASGVASIYYDWTTSITPTYKLCQGTGPTATIPLIANPLNSNYNLYIKVIDNAGNEQSYKNLTQFKFDYLVPTVNITPSYYSGSILKSIAVTATDSMSGISTDNNNDKFYYEWLKGSVVADSGYSVNGNIPLPSTQATYNLKIKASDKVGNVTEKTQTDLQIADIIPNISFTTPGDLTPKKKHTISVVVKDDLVGIDNYSYIIDTNSSAPNEADSRWKVTTQTSFETPVNGNGTYYLHIKAVNKIAVSSIKTSDGFLVDNTPPVVSITPNGSTLNKLSYYVNVQITDLVSAPMDITKKYAVLTSRTFPTDLTVFTENTLTVDDVKTDKYLHILATDKAGNETRFTSNAFESDKISPTGTIEKKSEYYYTNQTDHSVVITADDNSKLGIQMQIKINAIESAWADWEGEKSIQIPKTNGEHTVTVRFKDSVGNVSAYLPAVRYYYDDVAPSIQIQYSTTDLTNQNVTATATATDNTATENTFLTDSSHVFTANGTFDFEVKDQAGNQRKVTAKVENIDKESPTVLFETIHADANPHKSVNVKINADDKNGIASLKYRFVKDSESTGEFTSCENNETVTLANCDGNYKLEVIATDNATNQVSVKSALLILDNTPPTPIINYNPPSRTSKNVTASISFNEPAIVTNNNAQTTYLFTDNGTFTFEFKDTAGNTATAIATVDWIDREQPRGQISMSNNNQWTKENVTVNIISLTAGAEIRNVKFNDAPLSQDTVEDLGDNSYLVKTYGTISYEIYDVSTEITGNDSAVVKIDRTAPTITKTNYSTTQWTNSNVVVTVEATDNSKEPVTFGEGGNTYTFTQNGSYTFIATDVAGNKFEHFVEVTNIDKSIPLPTATYYVNGSEFDINKPINQDITAKITFDEGGSPVTIIGNDGSDEYVFTSNSSTTIKFQDDAGNKGEITIGVNNIDKNPPTGSITYSYSGFTNQPVIATLKVTDTENDVIITSEGGNSHTFTENGEFEFVFKDEAGNVVTLVAKATRIDTTPPKLSYSLSTTQNTYFSVIATVEGDEDIIFTNNKGLNYYQFNNNGSFKFTARDIAGNTTNLDVTVTNIIKEVTPIVATYSTDEPTNSNVVATITPVNPENDIYILNNGGSNRYTFTQNGEFTFKYTNPAGIEGEATVSVNNIFKTKPILSVIYSRDTVGTDEVVATIRSDKDVTFSHMAPEGVYVFKTNHKVIITATDAVGNSEDILLETNLIDNTPPKISINKPSESVVLGGTFDKKSGVSVSDDISQNLSFTVAGDVNTSKEGVYTLTYSSTDNAGNTTTITKKVTVYSPKSGLILSVNGMILNNEDTVINTEKIKIEVLSNNKDVRVKILPGKRGIGEFKSKGEFITSEYTFNENGYYTIYAIDGERNFTISNVFVQFN